MLKKIIASLILACFLFVNIGGQIAHADEQSTWYSQDYFDWQARVYDEDNPDEIFGERYTAAQVEWVIYGIAAFIINHIVGDTSIISCAIEGFISEDTTIVEACIKNLADILGFPELTSSNNVEDEGIVYAHSINPINNVLSDNRPISGIKYLKDSASKFNLIPEVKAQTGYGFTAASAIRDIWVVIRNTTYFFLILIIIAMSFMIMFRFKISPQTIITVQSALPKIIGALILITFSYAIAGLMIDMMYVVIGIIAAILANSGLFVHVDIGSTLQSNVSWSDMYIPLIGSGFMNGIFAVMGFYSVLFPSISLSALSSNILGAFFFGLTAILSLLLTVIVCIVILIVAIKIFWMLIKTYVATLFLVAAGPIFILTGGVLNWLKNLASNLAVFVAVGPMLAFSFLFLANALPNWWFDADRLVAGALPFNPNSDVFGASTWQAPFLGFSDMDVVWLFISLVIMTLIPNVANIIKSAMQRKPFGYGTAVGSALGAGAGAVWSPFGTTADYMKESVFKQKAISIQNKIAGAKFGQKLFPKANP